MNVRTVRWDIDNDWPGSLGDDDSPNTMVLVFADSSLLDGSGALDELIAAYPSSCVVGCSTAGEILDDTIGDGTITVAITKFETTSVHVVAEPVAGPDDSFAAGRRLAERLFAGRPIDADDGQRRTVLVLSEGLDVSGTLLVDGMASVFGPGVTISGGLAADGPRFERTWVLVDGQPRRGYVVALSLTGPDLRVGFGSRGGWDSFGPERLVTKSRGTVLHELDGRPALELYKDYLGARAAELPASALLFPLAIRHGDRTQVVRTILAVDEDAQTMTFAGDIPEGSRAQLMRANSNRLIEGAHEAALDACKGDCFGSVLAVAISCVGRRLLLGRRTEDELEAVKAGLGADVVLAGFYSYGEISPDIAGMGELQNQTMTLTTFAERPSTGL